MKKSKAYKQMVDLTQTPRFNAYIITKPSGHKLSFPYLGELTPEMIKRFEEVADKIKEPSSKKT